MTRWEYTHLNVYGLTTAKAVAELNRLGREGWEAIALIEFDGSASAFYLKRPLGRERDPMSEPPGGEAPGTD